MKRLMTIAMMLAPALPAAAQTGESLPSRRIEIDVGGGWLGGARLGSPDANLRAADAPEVFRLFSVDGRLAAAPTFHLRTGFAFNQRIGLEGGVTISRTELRASVSNDVEAAPPVTIAERVDQYGFDAGVVVMIHELGLGSRTLPFVAAGAGYLRQLHEGRTVVEHGRIFHTGGGLKHWVLARTRGVVRSAGFRGDARLYVMSGGVAFEDGPRFHGAISGSVFLTF